ncbi:MAG TPA: FkbM family methyltransferase [Solirubrobacteraceae bacterium]|nr:FkbM family methyltransferase [Solirubrobacteraceae bacterium]
MDDIGAPFSTAEHAQAALLSRYARTAALLALTRLAPARRRALRALAPLGSGELTIAGGAAGGLRLAAATFPLEHVHAHHLLRGTLERPVQDALRRHVAPGAVVYDVGANLGFFSLLAARLTGPDGRVYAFEPVPANAAAVRANAAANGLGRVTVLELALGEVPGRAALTVPDDASWAFLERYAPTRAGAGATLEVRVATADALVADGTLEPPGLVKLDVEGAELDVLTGMAETLRAHRPVLIAEMHGHNAEFVRRVEALGYRVTNLERPVPVAGDHDNTHALAVPAD